MTRSFSSRANNNKSRPFARHLRLRAHQVSDAPVEIHGVVSGGHLGVASLSPNSRASNPQSRPLIFFPNLKIVHSSIEATAETKRCRLLPEVDRYLPNPHFSPPGSPTCIRGLQR